MERTTGFEPATLTFEPSSLGVLGWQSQISRDPAVTSDRRPETPTPLVSRKSPDAHSNAVRGSLRVATLIRFERRRLDVTVIANERYEPIGGGTPMAGATAFGQWNTAFDCFQVGRRRGGYSVCSAL
jgi:hypothetical protein